MHGLPLGEADAAGIRRGAQGRRVRHARADRAAVRAHSRADLDARDAHRKSHAHDRRGARARRRLGAQRRGTPAMSALPQAFRASILHFLSDPGATDDPRATQYFDDGLLVVADGRVLAAGDATDLLPTLPAATPVTDCRPALILP